jgi:hypothetical protein
MAYAKKWKTGDGLLITAYRQIRPQKLKGKKIIEAFGSVEQFIAFHNQPVYLKNAVAVE